ncbi:MAG: GNAT family N-acetyltransferase [Bryobacterales bacterium]|nr:GNAT family N-acetyltransferase [Bryobacterales bacterium]
MIETKVWRSFRDAEATVRPFLAEHTRNPFLSFDWTAEYSRCVREPQGWQPLPVGFFRTGRMVAFAALSERLRAGGIRIVSFTGEGRGCYLGLAGEVSPEIVAALRREAARESPHTVLRLSDVPKDDPLLSALGPLDGFTEVRRTPIDVCPFRDLRPGAPRDSASHRKTQQTIHRHLRRLKSAGEVRHVVLDFDARREEALAWLPRLWALHDLRHHERRNPWTAPANREFLGAYLKRAGRSDAICFVLLLDGAPVSFELGLRMGNALCMFLTACHPGYPSLSLTQINRSLSFDACGDLGVEIYDLGRGEARSKRVWTSGARTNLELVAAAGTSWRARLAAAALAAMTRARIRARDHGASRSKLKIFWSACLTRAGRLTGCRPY